MAVIQQPAYLLCMLMALVWLAEWLATKNYFRQLGSAMIIIIAAAILANLHIIPSASQAPPLYDYIFDYAAPLGIFYLLLEVKLTDLKLAGLSMILSFYWAPSARWPPY